MHWGVFNLKQVTVKRHMKDVFFGCKKVTAYKGMAMHTHAIELATKALSRASPCCMLARKANQMLELCIPVLLP